MSVWRLYFIYTNVTIAIKIFHEFNEYSACECSNRLLVFKLSLACLYQAINGFRT